MWTFINSCFARIYPKLYPRKKGRIFASPVVIEAPGDPLDGQLEVVQVIGLLAYHGPRSALQGQSLDDLAEEATLLWGDR